VTGVQTCALPIMQALRNIFINYPKQYNILKDKLMRLNNIRQDLLHVLEIGKLDAIEQMRITKELKKVSKERRLVKDDLEVLTQLKSVWEGKTSNKDISEVIGKSKSKLNHIENRESTLRVRTDLQQYLNRDECEE